MAPRSENDENGSRVPLTFNIAEMKRLTQDRLRMQKQQQSVRNPYADKKSEKHLVANVRQRGSQIKTVVNEVSIPAEGCTLRELASRMSMKLIDVRNKLLELGETVDGTAVSEQPVRARGVRRRGMRARLAAAKGTEGDSYIEADVGELVVLEMGLQPKRYVHLLQILQEKIPLPPSQLLTHLPSLLYLPYNSMITLFSSYP